MQEYISKQHRILRPAEQIYAVISRFDNLTPAVADRVEEWQATEETCSFKAKGFTVRLRMEERIEPRHVKIVGDDGGIPMDFAFWIQLHKVSDTDTRMRLVLHIELNMMMKMMIGGKLQGAIDQIATISFMMNDQTENIGARRLHTILEKLLEDISFNIPEMEEDKLTIDEDYVKERFQETIHAEDLDRYIL